MSLFVDTSVWSHLLRRDSPSSTVEVGALIRALETGEPVTTSGLVLQELLQGFTGPRAAAQILDRFSAIPLLNSDREDHGQAADLRNRCRRGGIQIGTLDALLAQLCIRHELAMLTTDQDFAGIARFSDLRLWRP